MNNQPPNDQRNLLTRLRAFLRRTFSGRKAKRGAPQEPFDPWLGNQTIDDEGEEETPVDLKRLSEIYVIGMLVVIILVSVLCFVFLIAPGSR